jgi:hypothetical protein
MSRFETHGTHSKVLFGALWAEADHVKPNWLFRPITQQGFQRLELDLQSRRALHSAPHT